MDNSATLESPTSTPPNNGRVKEFFRKFIVDLVETFWVYTGIPLSKGKSQARKDLQKGKIVLKTFGKPAKWRNVYAEMLKANHGIDLESVSDEMVGPKLREEIRGYNSVVKSELRKKHGKDFLDMVVERAKDRFTKEEEERQKAAKQIT